MEGDREADGICESMVESITGNETIGQDLKHNPTKDLYMVHRVCNIHVSYFLFINSLILLATHPFTSAFIQ